MTDLPSWCRVGVKVVCVESQIKCGVTPIFAGGNFVIRSHQQCPISGRYGIRLEGVNNLFHPDYGEELMYAVHAFRPLASTKTEAEDLAYFKQFLQSSIETSHWKQDERAD